MTRAKSPGCAFAVDVERMPAAVDFVMFRPGQPRDPHVITDFPIAARPISSRLAPLRALLNASTSSASCNQRLTIGFITGLLSERNPLP